MTSAGRQVPAEFRRALHSLRDAQLRPEIRLSEIPAPTRVAPYAVALTGELTRPGHPSDELADGRFIALHDPSGHVDWRGTFRVVILVRSSLDADMSGDPLLGTVAWSWLTEALATHVDEVDALSGTVTRVANESFGTLEGSPSSLELEVRASWTPRGPDLTEHLHAWADLLSAAAGIPTLPEGVTSIEHRR